METFEVIVFLLQNLSLDMASMSYVLTKHIFSIFISNIIVDKQKRLCIKRNPLFFDMLDNQFSQLAPNQTQLEHFYNVVNVVPVLCYRDIFHIYSSLYTDRSAFVSSLTKKQRVVYGMEENTILSSNSVVK